MTLIDRALAVGDVVKRRLSDPQSGTIVSTSLKCALRPVINAAEYSEKDLPAPHGICPDYYLPKSAHHKCRRKCLEQPDPAFIERNKPIRDVPASEIKYWNQYRLDDYIIYQDWTGQITSVTDEVTVRLSNGSVVVVEDPTELDEFYWLEGSRSSELHRRLFQNDYVLNWSKKSLAQDVKAKDQGAEPCYPGQIVQTKKGNLRRGRWKFGAYDPNVVPKGIVVDVRIVQLSVSWISSNIFKPHRNLRDSPPTILDLDTLESGEITLYDRSRKPQQAGGCCPAPTSYSPDISFGNHVRFKDIASAALKYGGSLERSACSVQGHFNRVPRTATQGFDMNVLEIVGIRTQVNVHWQDGTLTEEDSTFLVPYNNVDEQEVWPGDVVSFKANEQINLDSSTSTYLKLGIVQSADAGERTAKIRWFKHGLAAAPIVGKDTMIPSRFGPISDEHSLVSLYEIELCSAYGKALGDLVIIIPDPLPPVELIRTQQPSDVQQLLDDIYQGLGQPSADHLLPVLDMTSAGEYMSYEGHDIDWLGEIVEVKLDGTMTVRLGAAPDVRDIQLPSERCIIVRNDGYDQEVSDSLAEEGEEEEEILGWESDVISNSSSDNESLKSNKTIDMQIEYEGGDRMDDEPNDDMWTTEEEEQHCDVSNSASLGEQGIQGRESQNAIESETKKSQQETAAALQPPLSKSLGTASRVSHEPTIPPQFCLLEESVPVDHHFIATRPSLTATKMRRIMYEYSIIRDSLPEGVFARSWDCRIDLLRILIIGPRDTPYELCPFIFDFHFNIDFPDSPPEGFFHSWTDGRGRINPNLYEDGKICLSLLGTWPGDDEKDSWNKKRSTVLQVIVSLLGLVLVKEPYYSKSGSLNP